MDYISAKELGKKWGISNTRVIAMARNGQLAGAMLIGNSWVFPSNIEKPIDGRTKRKKENKDQSFHFPIYSLKNWDMNLLSDEEKRYYEVEKRFNSFEYEYAYNSFLKIYNTTSNPSLKVGALYFIISSCGMLKKYKEALTYYTMLKELLASDIPYKKELYLLYYEIMVYVENNSFVGQVLPDFEDYDDDAAIMLILAYSYTNLINSFKNGVGNNLNQLVLISKAIDSTNYPLASIYLNIDLGLIYGLTNNKEMKLKHIRLATKAMIMHNLFMPLVIYYHYILDILPEIKDDIPSELLEKIRTGNSDYVESLRSVNLLSTGTKAPQLDIEDYEYFSYLIKNMTTEEIANAKGVTQKYVYNKYKEIREKVNAKNKKELLEKFKTFIISREFD